jgi:alpha-L-fucosidase
MNVNSEAIFDTRPWKIFGEGPDTVTGGRFQGSSISKLGAKDVRFTRTKNNRTVYAFILGLPSEGMTIKALGALGLSSPSSPGKIAKVEVLGSKQPPVWNQAENGLTIKMPEAISGIPEYGVTLKTYLA